MSFEPCTDPFLSMLEEAGRDLPRRQCRRCGHPILYFGGVWRHDVGPASFVSSGSGVIGCRAATWERLGGTWDESLDRRWRATPA